MERIMQVKTNNTLRSFLYGYQVPDKVLSDFSHLSEDEKQDGWIKYRNSYYHMSDFTTTQGPYGNQEIYKLGWHGLLTDTFFSGIVIKILDDGESYQIGTIYS